MSKKDEKEITLSADQIPAEGALGLLALGDVGVMLWREARAKKMKETMNAKKEEKKDEQKEG